MPRCGRRVPVLLLDTDQDLGEVFVKILHFPGKVNMKSQWLKIPMLPLLKPLTLDLIINAYGCDWQLMLIPDISYLSFPGWLAINAYNRQIISKFPWLIVKVYMKGTLNGFLWLAELRSESWPQFTHNHNVAKLCDHNWAGWLYRMAGLATCDMPVVTMNCYNHHLITGIVWMM